MLPQFSDNKIVLCLIKLRNLKEHNVKVTACQAILLHSTETISHISSTLTPTSIFTLIP